MNHNRFIVLSSNNRPMQWILNYHHSRCHTVSWWQPLLHIADRNPQSTTSLLNNNKHNNISKSSLPQQLWSSSAKDQVQCTPANKLGLNPWGSYIILSTALTSGEFRFDNVDPSNLACSISNLVRKSFILLDSLNFTSLGFMLVFLDLTLILPWCQW